MLLQQVPVTVLTVVMKNQLFNTKTLLFSIELADDFGSQHLAIAVTGHLDVHAIERLA